MCTTLQIVKVNPVRSGVARGSQTPYEWHTAECLLLDDQGNVCSVGQMNFPKELREKLGGVPPVGIYKATISMVALTGIQAGEISPRIVDLVPVPSTSANAQHQRERQ